MRNITRLSYKLLLSLPVAVALLLPPAGAADADSSAAKASPKVVNAATSGSKSAPLAPVQTGNDPAVTGKWELQVGTSTVDNTWATHPLPIHISLLPNGKLLFWGRDKRTVDGQPGVYDDYGHTTARVWDPFYRIFTNVNLEGPTTTSATFRSKTNLFCSGHSFLPDGRLLVTGGHRTADEYALDAIYLHGEGMGSANTNIFDFRTNTWADGPVMNYGRWYPFNVTLATGETLVVSGTYFNRTIPNTNRVGTLVNKIPQIYGLGGSLRNVKDIAVEPALPNREIQMYPLLNLLSNGKVSVAAASANGIENFLLTTSSVDGGGDWERVPADQNEVHAVGTAAMYQKDKILFPGGNVTFMTHNVSEVFELQPSGAASWTLINPMTYKRVNHTSTVLPDGKVLVTGGTPCDGTNKITCNPGDAVKTPELWNPQDGSWTKMAQHHEVRVYHSSAILLPDGRVLVGGGGLPAAEGEIVPGSSDQTPCLSAKYENNQLVPPRSDCREYGHKNVEIFSPPYLFLPGGLPAPRPAITSAPKEVTYGQHFTVGVGRAAPEAGTTPAPGVNITPDDIESAVLIRLGSVTHGFNQDQRRVPLTIYSRSIPGRSVTLVAPESGAECPPGHYMLFLMKRNATTQLTPSVAKIVRVNRVSAPVIVQAVQGRGETRKLTVTLSPNTAWAANVTGGSDFITDLSFTPQGSSGGMTTAYRLSFNVAANGTGKRRPGEITLSVPGQDSLKQVITVYQGRQFTDVPSTVSEDAPSKLDAMKLTSGCTDTTFCFNDRIKRGELAVFLVRGALNEITPPPTDNRIDVEPPRPSKVTFADVAATHMFYKYIEDLAKRGITSGCSTAPLKFCPEDFVNRAELAAFVIKAMGIVAPPQEASRNYPDLGSQWDWARPMAVEVMKRNIMYPCAAMVTGHDDTGYVHWFCPGDYVTRGEVAAVLSRLYGY